MLGGALPAGHELVCPYQRTVLEQVSPQLTERAPGPPLYYSSKPSGRAEGRAEAYVTNMNSTQTGKPTRISASQTRHLSEQFPGTFAWQREQIDVGAKHAHNSKWLSPQPDPRQVTIHAAEDDRNAARLQGKRHPQQHPPRE